MRDIGKRTGRVVGLIGLVLFLGLPPIVLRGEEEAIPGGGDAGWLELAAENEDEASPTLLRWNSDRPAKGGASRRDQPLASDRPDFTEASSTVGRWVTQLECGYTYFADGAAGNRLISHSFPELLLRQGLLTEWLELRVGWSFNSETSTLSGTGGTAHGSDDLYVGLKLGLTPQQGWLPEMALMPQMQVPLGGDFSADRTLPGLNWLYGWDLTERFSFGMSTQYNLSVDEFTDKLHGEFAQSATFGVAYTERLSGYYEWFAFVPAGADTERPEHYFDTGLTYRWTNDLQFDLRSGWGLSPSSTDWFLGTGVVVRF